MRQIIWASILLGLAVVLMPLLFVEESSSAAVTESYEPPVPSEAPAPSPSPEYETAADEETIITVLSGEEIVETTMAEYLPKALAAEMPASFHQEALKAQAVAARTYILYCTEHEKPKHPQADVCGDSGCCLACMEEDELRAAWGGAYEENLAAITAAAADTDGQLLTYDAQPILASFHSSSAGRTEDGAELWGEVPYLVCVSSPETGRDVPDFVTSVEVSAGNLKETVCSKADALFPDPALGWGAGLDESGRSEKSDIGGESSQARSLEGCFRCVARTSRWNMPTGASYSP